VAADVEDAEVAPKAMAAAAVVDAVAAMADAAVVVVPLAVVMLELDLLGTDKRSSRRMSRRLPKHLISC
jgi:hypothetical protein